MNVVERFRRPRYTGENRCVPCTVVNIVLAAGLAVALAAATVASGGGRVPAATAGASLFALCAVAIYLRGYLVPGTPWFTETYFPDWALRRFEKGPAATDGGVEIPAPSDAEVDVEATLLQMGALVECDDEDDLCMPSYIRTAFREQVMVLRVNDVVDDHEELALDLAAILQVDADDLTVTERDGTYEALVEGRSVGQWASRAAVIADIAGAHMLGERTEEWDELTVPQRGQVLNGLRIFLERCPACDGDVSLDQEEVRSCCRSVDVYAVTCDDCGDRLFETEAP